MIQGISDEIQGRFLRGERVGHWIGRSEGRWFEARLVASLPFCFLRQETLLHIVSLHPGVQMGNGDIC